MLSKTRQSGEKSLEYSFFLEFRNFIKSNFIIVKTSDGRFKYSITKSRILLANDQNLIVPTPTTVRISNIRHLFFIWHSSQTLYCPSTTNVKEESK